MTRLDRYAAGVVSLAGIWGLLTALGLASLLTGTLNQLWRVMP